MTRGNGEFSKIARLAALFGAQRAPGVTVGIGDDAAVLRPPTKGELVWTIDTQVEGRHFRRAWMTLEDIGWRSFVAAASDLAAMGAEPWCALSSVALPSDMADDAFDALARGQAEAALAVGCPIVGGNLSGASELSVTTTLLGTADRAVRRSGARLGQGIWVAGELGLAAAGLRALMAGRSGRDVEEAIAAFWRPKVLVENGRTLGRSAHAAIDVSDGLAQDVGHIAAASHVALVLDEASLMTHAGDTLQRAAISLNESALELVINGGEGYALVATASAPLDGFTRIGDVEAGDGVWLRAANGERRALQAKGWDHFDGEK